jgi:hypothetical protein
MQTSSFLTESRLRGSQTLATWIVVAIEFAETSAMRHIRRTSADAGS